MNKSPETAKNKTQLIMEYKKRLLKDLPFDSLTKGKVLYKENGTYKTSGGKTFYENGGDSSRSTMVLGESGKDIVDVIWNNEEWFENADLNHIKFIPETNSITLHFDPIDLDDVEVLTKGLIHILSHLKDGCYTWNKFKDITTEIRNS